jgi:hypothetical protein
LPILLAFWALRNIQPYLRFFREIKCFFSKNTPKSVVFVMTKTLDLRGVFGKRALYLPDMKHLGLYIFGGG